MQLYAGAFAECRRTETGTCGCAACGDDMPVRLSLAFRQINALDGGQVITRASCLAAGHTWKNPPFGNFDNIMSAALLLFEVSSLEGWPTVMFRGIDSVGPDQPLVVWSNPLQVQR